MNILVCGTREHLDIDQRAIIRRIMLGEAKGPMVIIEGAASGVDEYAFRVAEDNHWGHRRFPADWQRFGKSAGPIRNQQMLDENDVDLVLAFPGPESRGTWDMVERAVKNRIPVRVYPL